jgi:hypothetical protein
MPIRHPSSPRGAAAIVRARATQEAGALDDADERWTHVRVKPPARRDDTCPYMDDHAKRHGRRDGWLAVLALAIRAFPNSGAARP